MSDQYTLQDPRTQYAQPDFPSQIQAEPGLAKAMSPKPDHGENTYRGCNRLSGRKAIVTGADSGIGRATAIAFAREGADIVLNYLPSEEADAKEVIDLIKKEGRKAVACPSDISEEKNCRQLIDTALAELGSIDILALIAGRQISVTSLEELETQQLMDTFATNVYSMFWLCKMAIPHMKPGSTIINTTSIQAVEPSPTLKDYAATKAAIYNFTQNLAQEAIEKGIRVNAVAPGPIWTPLQPSHGQPPEAIPEFGKNNSLYGRPGQPAEVAPAYVFLASQESSYITGEIIGVTGGKPVT